MLADAPQTTQADILAGLRARSDDPLASAAASEIRRLRAVNRALHRRAQSAEGPLVRAHQVTKLELDAVRGVMDAFGRSSNAAWQSVRDHHAALEQAMLLAADNADEAPGLGFEGIVEVCARSISRLYPGGQPAVNIVQWARNGLALREGREARGMSDAPQTTPPTRAFADTVREQAERDPAFAEALEEEAVCAACFRPHDDDLSCAEVDKLEEGLGSFTVRQGGLKVAAGSGPWRDVQREAMHYAAVYGRDGPLTVTLRKLERRKRTNG